MKRLSEIFGEKIYGEFAAFKNRMLQEEPFAIFQCSYEITIKTAMYESLLESSQKLGQDALEGMLSIPRLLAFLYEEWLGADGTGEEELERFLQEEMEKF